MPGNQNGPFGPGGFGGPGFGGPGGFGRPGFGFGGPGFGFMPPHPKGGIGTGGAAGYAGPAADAGVQNLFIFPELRSKVKHAVKRHGVLKGTLFGFVNYLKEPFLTFGDDRILVKAEYGKETEQISNEEYDHIVGLIEKRRIIRSYNYGYISEEEMTDLLNKQNNNERGTPSLRH